jgi:hypothetical protein
MVFRRGTTCFKCRIAINNVPLLAVRDLHENQSSEALVQETLHSVGQTSLQMANPDIALRVWILS